MEVSHLEYCQSPPKMSLQFVSVERANVRDSIHFFQNHEAKGHRHYM